MVNGEPITALDIEQRSKLTQLSTQKTPARQEVIDELITEKLKVREAKRFGLEVCNAEVDSAFAAMASRMRLTPEQLTQQLAKSGINVRYAQAPHSRPTSPGRRSSAGGTRRACRSGRRTS